MSSRLLLLALSAASLLTLSSATGCSRAQPAQAAPRSAEPRPAGAFTSLVSLGSPDVRVVVGEASSLSVHCDRPEDEQYVETRLEGDALIVDAHFPHQFGFFLHFGAQERCRVDLKTPKLASVHANGSGDVEVTGSAAGLGRIALSGSGDVTVAALEADTLDVSASGSGDLKIGALNAERFVAKKSGSGDVMAAGKVKSFELKSSGSGDVQARSLKTEEARIRSSGSADVSISASRKADVSTTGSGDVTITGNPAERNCDADGSGDIRWE